MKHKWIYHSANKLHEYNRYAYSPDTIIASSQGKEVHNLWAFYLHYALAGSRSVVSSIENIPEDRVCNTLYDRNEHYTLS